MIMRWKFVWIPFLYAITATFSQADDNNCFNSWQGDLVSNEEMCNIFDGPTTLSMTCRTNRESEKNISLVWYYTQSLEDAGLRGITLEEGSHLDFVYTVTPELILGNASLVSVLELRKVFAEGYYWCMVRGTMHSHQNPTQVLRIADTCYPDMMCSEDSLAVLQRDVKRCASGDIKENITIVDVQDVSGCGMPAGATTVAVEGTTEKKNEVTGTDDGIDGGATTTSGIMTATFDVTSGGGTTLATTVTTDEGGGSGLPAGVVWLIVGLGIALLLVVIALLLIIIGCLHCARRKVKDNSHTGMAHHFDNHAYLASEPGSSNGSLANSYKQQDSGLVEGNHTYAVIPENFTLAACSGEHSPTAQTAQAPAVGGGDYESIDLDPIMVLGDGARKHQYEAVINDDEEVGYNRLQRAGSKSRNLSSSASASGASSVSPVVPARVESTTPLSPAIRESAIFDSPEYSQLNKPAGQHINIYKTMSIESSSGGVRTQRQNELPLPNRETAAKAGNTVQSRRRTKDDDYLQDAAIFIVNGLAHDETNLSTVPPDTSAAAVPTDCYTSLQAMNMNQETDYSQTIVSSHEKYVSERGHLYQVLEGGKTESGSAVKDRDGGITDDGAMCGAESQADDEELGFVVTNLDALTSSDEVAADAADVSVVYHTLLHSSASEKSRELTPGSAYDVIDRNANSGSRASLNKEPAYNVINRKISGSYSGPPPGQYDSLEPQANSPNGKATYNVTDRKISGGCTGPPSAQYSCIEPHVNNRRENIPAHPPAGYAVVAKHRNVASSSSVKSADSSSPPPSYSSLGNVGGGHKNGPSSYRTVEPEGELEEGVEWMATQ